MAMQLNVVNPSTAATAAPAATTGTKAPKEFYINPGYYAMINGKSTFVSLPWGLACDGMPEVKVEGSNPDYVALCKEKNKLRALVMDALLALEPGTDDVVTDLVFQIRRNKLDKPVVEANEVVGSLLKLNFASKKG